MATAQDNPTGPITATPRPRPGGTLIAAAARITSAHLRDFKTKQGPQDWQDDAWTMFDLVGEQHFLATTLANRLGQARLFVGRIADDPTDPPEPVEEGPVADAFDAFAGSHGQQAQLVSRLGVNLFVAGDGWVVGIPRHLLPANRDNDDEDGVGPSGPSPSSSRQQVPGLAAPDDMPGALLTLSDLEWRALSVAEVQFDQTRVTLKLGSNTAEYVQAPADDLFLVRVWRPHPQRWWEADSPTRASLPVLRELVGLTEHVSAQIDSRLAGAGVFLVPQTASDAILARLGVPEDADDDYDPFAESLMTAMMTPIKDRSNASAFVPLVTTVPDDTTEKFKHISFSTPLDDEARELREEAIRRLALGQDCPPEILLGVGDMNHWGGWLVREDTVTTHIEPPLALICDALTTQFLRPVLIQSGMEVDEAEQYVIWFDISDMIVRPSRTQDAKDAYAAGVISDEALRDALGFSDGDAPPIADPAVSVVMEMIKGAPSLAQNPGIPALVEQIRAVTTGTPTPTAPAEDAEPAADTGEGEPRPPSGTINDVDTPNTDTTPPPAEAAALKGPVEFRRDYVSRDDIPEVTAHAVIGDNLERDRLHRIDHLLAKINTGRRS